MSAGHLLDVATDLDFDGRWIAPIVLVTLGVAGLAGILAPAASRATAPATTTATSRRGAGGEGEDAGSR